jgi:replicative DNA helicase
MTKREKVRPHLFDYRESGVIENDATLLLAVYLPNDGGSYTGEDEILLLKQGSGTTGPLVVSFIGSRMKFEPKRTQK